MPNAPKELSRPDGESIAYHHTTGKAPGIIFCGGFMSDMGGTKALALEEHCQANGLGFVRFDYLGHGESSGSFADKGCISRWTEDAVAILDELTMGPQIVVGSSMGGWVMLRLALARPARIAGLASFALDPGETTSPQSCAWRGLRGGDVVGRRCHHRRSTATLTSSRWRQTWL